MDISSLRSQSLANLRFLPNHANVRSTTHRLGSRTKPFSSCERMIVCIVHSSPIAFFNFGPRYVNRHSTVTHYQRPNMTHLQEGGTGEEVSEILFFSAKSKRRPSLIYSMQIIPVCLSIVARRKGVSATRRGGSNWTPISLLVGHPCKLFHTPIPTIGKNMTQIWKLFT